MMRRGSVVLLAFLSVLLFAGIADAHVSVLPKQSAVNGFERYTVRVPTEKDLPTTKLRIELPAGSTFSSVLPVPGWTFATEKDATGKVVALVWSGGEIRKGEFFEFGISVRNPKTPGAVAWKAFQTYADGSVVEWTGPTGSDKPAPAVTLVESAAPATEHGAPAVPASAASAASASAVPASAASASAAPAPAPAVHEPAPAPAPAAQSNLGAWLGGAALLVSLVALVLAARK